MKVHGIEIKEGIDIWRRVFVLFSIYLISFFLLLIYFWRRTVDLIYIYDTSTKLSGVSSLVEHDQNILKFFFSFTGLSLLAIVVAYERYLSQKQSVESKKNKLSVLAVIKNTDIYLKFKKATIDPKLHISEEDWSIMEKMLLDKAGEFMNKLMNLHPINQLELRLSILLKLGFSISEIAVLTNRTKQAISLSRKRLYAKCFNKDGLAADWDNYIYSL